MLYLLAFLSFLNNFQYLHHILFPLKFLKYQIFILRSDYAIRTTERHKHYGTKILELAIKKCKALGIDPIYAQANKNNIYSQKVIENNGGKLYLETETKYYVIQKCWKFFWINSIFCNFLKTSLFLWKTKNAKSLAKSNNSAFLLWWTVGGSNPGPTD